MPLTFERSSDTNAVVDALRGCNDEISYIDLARLTKLTATRLKAVLPSARRVLTNETGVLFGVIRGIGLRRLTDRDKVKKPEAFKKRVVRGATREIKHLSTISDVNALPKTDQHALAINRTVLNVLKQQAQVRPEEPKTKIAPLPLPDVARLVLKK